jgi:hypothetical protein
LETQLKNWRSESSSFFPTEQWIKDYSKAYNKERKKEKELKIKTPSQVEDLIPSSNWLAHAKWPLYYKKVLDGLVEKERDELGYSDILDIVEEKLPLPWKPSVFDDIENRRIIGGMGVYGWLGHVAASGSFRKFMANGSVAKKRKAITAINNICGSSLPIDFKKLEKNLKILITIGPSVKVWSRIFTLLRPDVFCTVASPSVRANLSKTLGIPQKQFEYPEGYLKLLQLVHSCPWFKQSKPKTKKEKMIWERRAAFMDAIFYEI